MHYSTYHGNETNVVITITNYTTPREMVIFGNFVQRFNITIELTWSDRITHIVVNSKELCEYRFTDKIFKGVLSNKFIITMDWIRDCLESDFLISEVINKVLIFSVIYLLISFVLALLFAT